MVYAYVGLPGSGKTLSSLALLLSELRAGRHVFTNIVGLDPFMISLALSARGKEFTLSHVDKYLHRFTLEYGVNLGDPAPAAPIPSSPNVIPASVPGFRRLGSAGDSTASVASSSGSYPVRKLSASLDKYRVKRKGGVVSYYNSEGLSLLLNDVMSRGESVVIRVFEP